MFSGMLLGWAREGDLLRHDVADVDFAFDAADEERLLAALPQLRAAGFEPLYRFRLYSYGDSADGPCANELALPAQPLEPFAFLGRTWLKVRDHEAELEALYGDWRTPDPGYDYMCSPAIVRRYPWDPSAFHWSGEVAVVL